MKQLKKKYAVCIDCGNFMEEEKAEACYVCYRAPLCEACSLEHEELWHRKAVQEEAAE